MTAKLPDIPASPAAARELLRRVGLLAALSDAELDAMARNLAWRRVAAREEIFSHLSTGNSIYFVCAGTYTLSMTTSFGEAIGIRRLGAGDHFGEIAALIGTPRSVAVRAATPGLLAEAPASAFRTAMATNALFAADVASNLARTVVILTDRLFELAALEVRFRLYSELLRFAGRGKQVANGIAIAPAPTHAALAASIGATRESVSRELTQLTSEGVLSRGRGQLVLHRPAHLAEQIQKRAGTTVSQTLEWPK
ncbi:MAG: Crp/Fnr family transcriptional regulator [Hyphomonadaceae bacterium]